MSPGNPIAEIPCAEHAEYTTRATVIRCSSLGDTVKYGPNSYFNPPPTILSNFFSIVDHLFKPSAITSQAMEPIYQLLTERAIAHKSRTDSSTNQNRVVVILAGPPGSGKSTIAEHVVERLNGTSATPFAAVVPMDGFHLPRSTLHRMPNSSEAYARRGASWTFDADGIADLVRTLSKSRFRSPEKMDTILAPSFDHAVKDPVENGIVIGPQIQFVLLEGNYLLLDEEPWRGIRELVDESWFVDVEPELARSRIAKRHVKSGIEQTMEAAYRRAEGNDLLNGVEIRKQLVKPDILVRSAEESS